MGKTDMFIRRAAATLLVDVQMAIRSGAWTPSRTHSPFPALTALDRALTTVASDDEVSDAVDALYGIMGDAMMAGEATIAGYEQFELGDIHPALLVEASVGAANDDALPLRRAA
jgi:hypothetical protein